MSVFLRSSTLHYAFRGARAQNASRAAESSRRCADPPPHFELQQDLEAMVERGQREGDLEEQCEAAPEQIVRDVLVDLEPQHAGRGKEAGEQSSGRSEANVTGSRRAAGRVALA